jgi:hypothetical protein
MLIAWRRGSFNAGNLTVMNIATPLLRLLLASALLVLSPIYLAVNRLPIAWIILPCAILTFISCSMQEYRQPRLIAACGASILVTLAGLYAVAYGVAGLL